MEAPSATWRSGLSVLGKVRGKVSLQTEAKECKGKQKRGRPAARTDKDMQQKAARSRIFAGT